MRVGARLATDDDIEATVRIADMALAEKLEQRDGPLWSVLDAPRGPLASHLAASIAEPNMFVAIGMINDVALGFCVAGLKWPHDDGPPVADMGAIHVERDARGVGVGEALMLSVIDWAVSRGCRGIDSITLPGDRTTKNFFESFGLVARAVRVHRPLQTAGYPGAMF